VQLPPFSRHLIPLRSEYSSQNPVLKHPQSMLWTHRQVYSAFHVKPPTVGNVF
jgi:hypothetical protein